MIDIQPHAEGALLPVRAQPGARRNEIRGAQDGALKVSVTQVAERGKANKAIGDLLCKQLKLKKSQLELLAGETAQQKRYLVRGVTAETLKAAVSRLLEESEAS
ncbi:MAG: DUF167 domain-containing protein [Planctomycetota bacterium]